MTADLIVKATFVLLAAGVFALLLRRASAAARHLVWLMSLAGLILLAILGPFVPALPLRVPGWIATARGGEILRVVTDDPASEIRRIDVSRTKTEEKGASASERGAAATSRIAPPASPLSVIWSAGALLVLGWWGLGRVGLLLLARRATPVIGAPWDRLLAEAASRSGVGKEIRLLRSSEVGSPVTWGLTRPVIVLPADADRWTEERKRVVLAHELAHAARGDVRSQLIANLACALYWFHPLAWVAAARLCSESERACDDLVVTRGTPRGEYATHLLDVAASSRRLRVSGMVAIGMARRSHLEGRLLAVLDAGTRRSAPGRGAKAASLLVLAAGIVPLAALRAAGPADTARPGPSFARSQTPGQELTFDSTVSAVSGGGLILDLATGGGVVVHGWKENKVEVRGRLAGGSWKESRVSLGTEGNSVILKSWLTVSPHNTSTSHRFEIMVPEHFDVRLKSAGGGITIDGVTGTFSGNTGGGDLVFEHAAGEARLTTGGGEIRVSESALDGRVSTGGGMVRIMGNKGDLKGSSGSGPVITEGEKPGTSKYRSAGGAIVLPDAPNGADVGTGGGEVRIGTAGGDVRAYTGGGNMDIGPVNGNVTATTGAGDVEITIVGPDGAERSVEVRSGNGKVVLVLPAGVSARFELETAYTEDHRRTRITSDFPVTISETPDWDDREGTPRKYVRGTGTAGKGGGLIKVRITNGDITVKKGN